ncbi:MAG: amidohydrolase [Actinobacteria bacterium]|nr:amidohydrolase [Actinomycetota bacterium]
MTTATLPAGDRYVVISADCHAGGSMDQYREHLDPAYVVEFDAWRNRYKNPFRDLHGDRRTKNWDHERRLAELDEDGIAGEVVFPNTVPPFFPTGALIARPPTAKDFPRRLAGIRAHNRWLAEWCSVAPERRAGVAQIFLNDVDEAVKDVRFTKEAGLRGGVLLPGRPDDSELAPLYDPVYEPLWSECEELGVVVNHHSGGGSPNYGKYECASLLWVVETSWYSHRALWHLIIGGVFERHPNLVFTVTEQGVSWIPSTLAMLDGFHAQMASGRIGELKYSDDQRLQMKPSEYFARNCRVGVSFPSPREAQTREEIGIDRFMWGSDYPHDEGTYPYTTEALRRSFAGTDPVELQQLLAGNAAEVYDFDMDALAPLAAGIGPLVAEVARPLDAVPDDSNSPAFTRA